MQNPWKIGDWCLSFVFFMDCNFLGESYNVLNHLIVLSVAPTVTVYPIWTTVVKGNSITLYCNASGKPTTTVTWARVAVQNQVLSHRESLTVNVGKPESPDNIIRYQCTASNGVGHPVLDIADVNVHCKLYSCLWMSKFACTQKIIAIRRGPNSLAPNNFVCFWFLFFLETISHCKWVRMLAKHELASTRVIHMKVNSLILLNASNFRHQAQMSVMTIVRYLNFEISVTQLKQMPNKLAAVRTFEKCSYTAFILTFAARSSRNYKATGNYVESSSWYKHQHRMPSKRKSSSTVHLDKFSKRRLYHRQISNSSRYKW